MTDPAIRLGWFCTDPRDHVRFMASTCSFKIRRGAGFPAKISASFDSVDIHRAQLTDQGSGDNNINFFGLFQEQGHFGIDKLLDCDERMEGDTWE